MIYYKQIKCQDNALKIHVEDRSQLLTQTDGSEEQQMTSLSGGGGQQKLLHVNFYYSIYFIISGTRGSLGWNY